MVWQLSDTTVYYSRFDGTSWHTTSFGPPLGMDVFYNSTSIVIDTNNHPHLALQFAKSGISTERGVCYATFDGTTWTYEKVATYSDPNGWINTYTPVVALAPDGHPEILFMLSLAGPHTSTLELAVRGSGGTWTQSTVDSSSDQSGFNTPCFNIDPAGHRHFISVYRNLSSEKRSVRYGSDRTGSWTTSTAVAGGTSDAARYVALALDSSNLPRVVYSALTGYAVHYLQFDGSSWTDSVVASPVSTLARVGLARNASGCELIAYCETNSTTHVSAINTATRFDNGAWTLEEMAQTDVPTNGIGIYLAAAVNASGKAVLGYQRGNLTTALLRASVATLSAPVVTPVLTGIDAPGVGIYRAGQNLNFTVHYSAPVTVSGTPQIGLTIGSASQHADYLAGSSTTTALVFRYTVQTGDLDSDGIAMASAISLNGGSIKDGANSDAPLAFTAPGTGSVRVDAVPPGFTTPNSTKGTFGVPFSFTIVATGAPAVYGAFGLPAGLSVDSSSGTISGIPTQTGSFSVLLGVADAVGNTNTAGLTLVIDPASTTSTLISAPNPSSYGQSVTITATVTSPSGIPTGSVSFFDGATLRGTATLVGGTATLTSSALSAGTHFLTAVYSANGSYGGSTSAMQSQTVNKVTAGISFVGLSQTYQGTPRALAVTTTPPGLSVNLTYDGSPAPPTSAGHYQVIAIINDSNYAGAQTNTLTIASAPLSVQVEDYYRAYGQTNPIWTVSFTGFVSGEGTNNLSGALISTLLDTNHGSWNVADTNTVPGEYVIVPGGLTSSNYAITFLEGTLTVTQAMLVVSADDQTRTFGTHNPRLTATITGFVNGENVGTITGSPVLTTTAVATSPPGTYDIVPTLGSLAATNYSFSFVDGSLVIGKAVLTVTADDQLRTYGEPNPNLTAHVTGFVNGDGPQILTGAPAFITPAVPASPVGSYDISPSQGTLAAPNYSLTFVKGQLQIVPATLNLTADNKIRVYGGANPQFSGTLAGVKNGDPITATFNTTATLASPVGSYAITPSLADPAAKAGNYVVSLNPGSLQVIPASLSVLANNQTRVYGSANPSGSFQIVGLLNGDTIAAQYSTSADEHTPVGAYPIKFSGLVDPDKKLGNYVVTTADAVLTVTPRPLFANADDQTRKYGAANPVFTGSLSGLQNGDPITASYETDANTGSPAGFYSIQVRLSDPANRLVNYSLNTTPGILNVTKASLTIRVQDSARAFGANNPSFSANIAGLAKGDLLDLAFDCAASASSPAGNYPIVPRVTNPAGLANYDAALLNGTLTVTAVLSLSQEPGFYIVSLPAMCIDTNATVNDGGTLNWAGATLIVKITTNTSPEDLLTIMPEGILSTNQHSALYGDSSIADFAGGNGTNALFFSFNANANSSAVTALLRQIAFGTADTNSTSRTVQFTLNVGSSTVTASRAIALDRAPGTRPTLVMATENIDIVIPFEQVLTNCLDLDSNSVTIIACDSASSRGAQVSIHGSSFLFSPPAAGLTGYDSFRYTVADSQGAQAVGTVNLRFLPIARVQIDASRLSHEGAQVDFGGTPGRTYIILSSTDFIHWTPIATVTATPTGLIEILDAEARNYPQRFYRAVTQY